jgi:hypothetical protein
MAEPTRLWRIRGVRAVGNALVRAYATRIPGTEIMAPAIHVNSCPDDLAEDGDAFEAFGSHIWAMTTEGRVYAERIAHDLALFGFAWIWPHEADHIRIMPAAMHMIHLVGMVEACHG